MNVIYCKNLVALQIWLVAAGYCDLLTGSKKEARFFKGVAEVEPTKRLFYLAERWQIPIFLWL